jgi:hypothetical protein
MHVCVEINILSFHVSFFFLLLLFSSVCLLPPVLPSLRPILVLLCDPPPQVTADPRKGLIVLTKSVDQVLHFQWKTRPNGEIEDDLMLFPGEQTFERVPECTTGRVFLMNLHGRKRFFWIQELKEDKDEENLKKVCDILKNGR